MTPFGLAIHGGAGAILRRDFSPQLDASFRASLAQALDAGYAELDRGASALDAVVSAIRVLEDCPLFNAGRGAVMNADGLCELDASIMDGRTRGAGAVAGLRHVQNPITLARDVMEKSPHVMLAGEGAERFAQTLGYSFVPNAYFQTELRRRQLEQAQRLDAGRNIFATVDDNHLIAEYKFGTVGCVALDRSGHLAAGTSTGGRTNKKFGRVGDSPIIGAGTYADDATCAVSATGHGEFFIRTVVAHDIAAQLAYKNAPLDTATAATLQKVDDLGGAGGVIAIDRFGNVSLRFTTPGMHRGFRLASGESTIELFGDNS